MRLKHVAVLSALGMMASSAGVWAFTPAAPNPGARLPVGQSPLPPGPVVELPVAQALISRPGTLSLEGRLGHRRLPSDQVNRTFVQLEVKATDSAPSLPKQALNLAIAIDRSGSMKGVRLDNALRAARGMLSRLRDGDVVSVVAYDTQVEVLIESTTIDNTTRVRVAGALDGVAARGDTCISCGIEAAMGLLQKRAGMVDRLLLLSDGEPTAGLKTVAEFKVLGERGRKMGCAISSIGVDVDYNERLLLSLAAGTNGRHHFAEQARDLTKVFDAELASLQSTVANTAVAELKLAPGVRLVRVLDRAFSQSGDRILVPLGSFASRDVKTVLVELELTPGAAGARPVANVSLGYTDLANGGAVTAGGALETVLAAGVTARLDPIVQARLARTGTADTLDSANNLFLAGDVGAARTQLQQRIDKLERQKRKFAKAPAAPRIQRDLDQQLEHLNDTAGEFAEAESDAPAPAEAPKSRSGKSSLKKSGGRALDSRR